MHVAVLFALVPLMGPVGDCKEVGAFDESFTFANRYRGNVYRIDESVVLHAVEMRLGMDGARMLHAAIHQLQPNGNWTRYPSGSADYVLEITEAEAGDFSNSTFRTIQLTPPVPLAAGFDYAIGFAWSDSVRFGKDVFQTYPRSTPADFNVGTVRGNVAINFTASPLPMNDEIDPFLSNQGAYAMRLCFTGACCLPQNGECVDSGESECVAALGQFTASGISCSELAENGDQCPLPLGACCHDDTCSFVNGYTCTDIGGYWFQHVQCGDPLIEPCEPRGGCCLAGGNCQDNQTIAACSSQGGSYRGDDVTCAAFPPCSDRFGTECKEVGAFDESFTFANRYRGNVYRIDQTVALIAIQMRLGMDGARTLHAAIHQLQPNGDWTRYPPGSSDHALEVAEADAGGFNDPTFRAIQLHPPILLLEGFDYAIGFAWSDSVRFGKDVFRTYPKSTPADFNVGTVRGNVAINFTASPLPMDDEIDPFFSNQGAYSMQLCVADASSIPTTSTWGLLSGWLAVAVIGTLIVQTRSVCRANTASWRAL